MISITERARRYINQMDQAISGQRGHDTTFKVACVLTHGFGFSPSQALPIIQEWNAGLPEKWSDSELLHKLESANKTASSGKPRGHLAESHNSQNQRFKRSKRPRANRFKRSPKQALQASEAFSRKSEQSPKQALQASRQSSSRTLGALKLLPCRLVRHSEGKCTPILERKEIKRSKRTSTPLSKFPIGSDEFFYDAIRRCHEFLDQQFTALKGGAK